MRSRLATSLRYILAQGDGVLAVPQESLQKFLTDLETRPVSPLAFSFYNDAVLAIEEDDVEKASQLLTELTTLPARTGGLEIIDLADPKQDAIAARYARFLNDDPSVSFDIFPPSKPIAEKCRDQIRDAFALLDTGDPDLAGEIRALLREIILATGTKDPKVMTFDGASSFMLWGAIILNADRGDGPVGMAQMLAHESAHNLLFGFSADEGLVENGPDELFSSPLRKDPRPMDGIYHATFVTARMYRVVHQLLQSGILDADAQEKAEKDLAENARLFKNGIETVQKFARLSPLGESVMRGASEYMASVS
jgi:HEXXH motif-containing protein